MRFCRKIYMRLGSDTSKRSAATLCLRDEAIQAELAFPPSPSSRFSVIDLSFLQVLTPAGDLYSHHVPELGRVILQPYSHPAHPAHPAHSSDEDNYQKSRKWRTQDHQILDVEVKYLVFNFNLYVKGNVRFSMQSWLNPRNMI